MIDLQGEADARNLRAIDQAPHGTLLGHYWVARLDHKQKSNAPEFGQGSGKIGDFCTNSGAQAASKTSAVVLPN